MAWLKALLDLKFAILSLAVIVSAGVQNHWARRRWWQGSRGCAHRDRIAHLWGGFPRKFIQPQDPTACSVIEGICRGRFAVICGGKKLSASEIIFSSRHVRNPGPAKWGKYVHPASLFLALDSHSLGPPRARRRHVLAR